MKILEPGQSAIQSEDRGTCLRIQMPDKQTIHPKENKWMGYIIEVDGRRIYHAGDTDFIPEMKGLENIYAALLPWATPTPWGSTR